MESNGVPGSRLQVHKLGRSHYYKFRAANLMFGFNSNITGKLLSFCEFNALRKNQLYVYIAVASSQTTHTRAFSSLAPHRPADESECHTCRRSTPHLLLIGFWRWWWRRGHVLSRLAFYEQLCPIIGDFAHTCGGVNKYRDYYFMGQYEVGQRELIDVHHHTYLVDMCAMLAEDGSKSAKPLLAAVNAANKVLVEHIFFSTQRRADYEKFMSTAAFLQSKNYFRFFLDTFLSVEFLSKFAGLGFAEINPKEKEINSLTQTVFYSAKMMSGQAYRMEYEFEKECINQMARSTLRKYQSRFGSSGQTLRQTYKVGIKIGQGYTYSKYNTLMHFLNVTEYVAHFTKANPPFLLI